MKRKRRTSNAELPTSNAGRRVQGSKFKVQSSGERARPACAFRRPAEKLPERRTPNAQSFAARLKARRLALGLTAEQLARRLTMQGIPTGKGTVHDWEQGRWAPKRFKEEEILKRL
jgi:ribosome-binding protein aMBF1 (putative translation factor)